MMTTQDLRTRHDPIHIFCGEDGSPTLDAHDWGHGTFTWDSHAEETGHSLAEAYRDTLEKVVESLDAANNGSTVLASTTWLEVPM